MIWTSRVARYAVCWFATVAVCLLVSASAFAQDKPPVGTSGGMSPEEKAMMDAMVKAATPGPNHQLLASVAGDWAFKSRMWMKPSAPPSESTGTVSYTTQLGGRFVEGMYRGEMMGMPFEGRGLMGYDNVSGQFQSTWADNMGTTIMLMTGQVRRGDEDSHLQGRDARRRQPGEEGARATGRAPAVSRLARDGVVRDPRWQGDEDDGDLLYALEVDRRASSLPRDMPSRVGRPTRDRAFGAARTAVLPVAAVCPALAAA